MNFIDLILILILIIGVYIGWCAGVFKSIADLISVFISTIIASVLSKLVAKPLYGILPFFNFSGRAEGIKSINIMFWRVVLHVILLIIILAIIDKIITKIKLKEKLINSMVEINLVSKILGSVLYVLVAIIFLFNALLVLYLPNLNFVSFQDSIISGKILNKMVIISKINKPLYSSEFFAMKLINEKNSNNTYLVINDKIIDYMVSKDLVNLQTIKELNKKDKLLVKRKNDSNYEKDEQYKDDDKEDVIDNSDYEKEDEEELNKNSIIIENEDVKEK